MSLMKTFALLQLLIIMNNVSVQAATLRIQGGSTVHVGDRVNITCTCDFNKCYQGVHFRISGVEHNYSILEGGGVTNYNNLSYTTDWNTLTLIYTLVLINATVNDNGTTYQCISSDHEKKAEWSNTETLIVLGSLANPTSSSDATSQPQKSVATSPTTTTTTTTTATMTTTTATPPTPVTSALSTETEGPTLKTNSEKTTEPMKEDDAPTYVYVAVGSGVGIVVYILTIVLIGLVISLKIKGKKAAERRSRRRTPSPEQQGANRYPISIPMVSNPVYSEVVSPSGPAPPYFTVDPCQFGDRQIVVRMDNKYHDVPQRKSVAAESLYDYIDMQ